MRPDRCTGGRTGILAVLACLLAAGPAAWALDSDRDQPATLEAEDFELDLRTGVRIYRGDVVFRQGSMRLDCDELVTYLDADGGLDRGVCTGDPGRFRQRPEGHEADVVGEAVKITMDRARNMVTLEVRAKIAQGPNTMTGRLITYRLDTERIMVKGGVRTSDGASGEAGGEPEESASPSRARLVIQPRGKKD